MREAVHNSATVVVGLLAIAQMGLWFGSWTVSGDRFARRPALAKRPLLVLAPVAVVWAVTDSRPQPVWLFVTLGAFCVAEVARDESVRRRRKRGASC